MQSERGKGDATDLLCLNQSSLQSAWIFSEDFYKKLPLHALRAHTVQLLTENRPTEALELIKKHIPGFYSKCRPAVRSSLLSL